MRYAHAVTRALRYLCLVVGISLAAVPDARAQDAPADGSDRDDAQRDVGDDGERGLSGPRQPRPKHIDLGVFIGGNYFSDQLELGNAYFSEQVPNSAFLLGLRGSYLVLPNLALDSSLAPRLAIELESKLALSSTGSNAQAMRDQFFAPVLGWRAQARLSLWSDYRLHPFLVVGAGGETVITSSPFIASGDSDAAVFWGLGAHYALDDAYGLRADVRHGITAGRTDLAAHTAELHVGVYYRFSLGEPPAPLPEPEPEPDIIEDLVTIETEPIEADEDGDGILDDLDECPTEPEIFNEIDDEDGCPEVDSDNDGLLGTRDQCPDAAEDLEGFEDEDGCPDLDNDEDGNPDVSDECPNTPENENGFEDEDGCPDELPDQVAAYVGVIRGIRFPSGSAQIRDQRSRELLAEAAKTLSEYPSLRIRISGHTDARGNERRNVELSRARADAVKWYLVDEGIEHDRIVTMGYGPSQPIDSNDTKEGRANNRRIEFELLQRPTPRAVNSARGASRTADEGAADGAAAAQDAADGGDEGDAAGADAQGSDADSAAAPQDDDPRPDGQDPDGADSDAEMLRDRNGARRRRPPPEPDDEDEDDFSYR
ncbi:MAG: hypothetical protein Tsb0020_12570 [Haliangiales bacterium]